VIRGKMEAVSGKTVLRTIKAGAAAVFIVEGKPRELGGAVRVTKATRKDALETARDFLNQGIPFVTIIVDDCVYTVEEFALTIINGEE
jgi:hypothetical protein